MEFPDLIVLEFHYRAIQLNLLDWRDFVNRPNPVVSALMAKMNIAEKDRARVKLECIRLLATLKLDQAKMQLIAGFIDTYLRLNAQEVEEFEKELQELAPQDKEAMMQLTTSWEEKGRQEGIQQGKQQGMASLITHQIERRFGPLDETVQERIHSLSPEQLEQLGEALWDFADAGNVVDWLARNAGES